MVHRGYNPFDANMRLAQVGIDLWNARRSYEWKVTFGLWALLAAAVTQEVRFSCWAGLLLLGFYTQWLYFLWRANNKNENFANTFIKKSQTIARSPQIEAISTPYGFFCDWAMVSYIG